MLSRFGQLYIKLGHAVLCHATLMGTVHEAEHKTASLLVLQTTFHDNREE